MRVDHGGLDVVVSEKFLNRWVEAELHSFGEDVVLCITLVTRMLATFSLVNCIAVQDCHLPVISGLLEPARPRAGQTGARSPRLQDSTESFRLSRNDSDSRRACGANDAERKT
jgi:hypothetical protein